MRRRRHPWLIADDERAITGLVNLSICRGSAPIIECNGVEELVHVACADRTDVKVAVAKAFSTIAEDVPGRVALVKASGGEFLLSIVTECLGAANTWAVRALSNVAREHVGRCGFEKQMV